MPGLQIAEEPVLAPVERALQLAENDYALSRDIAGP